MAIRADVLSRGSKPLRGLHWKRRSSEKQSDDWIDIKGGEWKVPIS
jgi:hypothetical protein